MRTNNLKFKFIADLTLYLTVLRVKGNIFSKSCKTYFSIISGILNNLCFAFSDITLKGDNTLYNKII